LPGLYGMIARMNETGRRFEMTALAIGITPCYRVEA
jgi:hypothetical protein